MVSVVSTMSVLDDQDLERRRNHNRHNTTAALCSLDHTPAAIGHDRGVPSVPVPLDGSVQMQAGKMAIVMATACQPRTTLLKLSAGAQRLYNEKKPSQPDQWMPPPFCNVTFAAQSGRGDRPAHR